jgi:hypothetical protein
VATVGLCYGIVIPIPIIADILRWRRDPPRHTTGCALIRAVRGARHGQREWINRIILCFIVLLNTYFSKFTKLGYVMIFLITDRSSIPKEALDLLILQAQVFMVNPSKKQF